MGSLLRTTARVPFSRTFSSTSLRLNTAAASATDGEQMIRTILTDRFQPSVLKVQDVSGEWPPCLLHDPNHVASMLMQKEVRT